MKGIQLDKQGDIRIMPRVLNDGKIAGMVVGDTVIQNASIVLELKQGELKSDPLLGPNLSRFIRSRTGRSAIEKQIRIHLGRAGINYEELEKLINIHLKTI